ncbi:MAG: azurin [Bacteroidota bacterium]
MKKLVYLGLIMVFITAFGCGEKKTEKKEDGFQVNRTKKEEKKEVDGNVIALSSNDLMQFDKSELRVKAGKTVTLTLRHTGKMEKVVMGHNFVLLAEGTDLGDFAAKAAVARETEYIPESDAIIAYTKLIGGGETTTISFEPPAVGTYDYVCSFPGHYGIMQGKFIVEP